MNQSNKTFLPVALLLICALPAAGQGFPWPNSFELQKSQAAFSVAPGVVMDPTTSSLYLMAPEGSLEAISIADGRLRWQTQTAAKPLLVFGDYLLAQAPTEPGRRNLEIRVLNAADGQLIHRTTADLPAGVRPAIDEGLGRSFEIQAGLEGQSLRLFWEYHEVKITGASPDLVPGADTTRQEFGQFIFNPTDGSLVVSEDGSRGLRKLPDLLPEERLPGLSGTQFRSADERNVMVSDAIADARVWNRYRWQILSREDGSMRGEIRAPTSWTPFMISGAVLVRVDDAHVRRIGDELVSQDRRLLAHRLSDGRRLWERTLRDPVYRGPFPP